MEHKETLQESVNEVLRKIGRNVILYQEFEYLLKFIVANGSLAGYASDLERRKAQQAEKISKQTMGQLIGCYIEHVNPDYEGYQFTPEEIRGRFHSFFFQYECGFVYYESEKEALARIVSERNALIHNLLPCFDTSSAESCEKLGKKLDDQSENIRNEIKELKDIINAFLEMKKQISTFLGSEKGKKEFKLICLQQSKLVVMLGDIAERTVRPDGWALMDDAARLLKQYAPEEIALLKEKYGHGSLKILILATEIFDVREEVTKKGGVRVLYRLKSDWMVSPPDPTLITSDFSNKTASARLSSSLKSISTTHPLRISVAVKNTKYL